MPDSKLSTRPLPAGVVTSVVWGDVLRTDGTPRDRFVLSWRHPERTGPVNLIIEMNPSGASETVADQTLLKNWGFSGRWNNGSFDKCNVVPFRATDPSEMQFRIEAMEVNQGEILACALRVRDAGGIVVVGWGTPSLPKPKRLIFACEAAAIVRALRHMNVQPMCLGVNADGSPRHSLMVGYDTPLVPFGAGK